MTTKSSRTASSNPARRSISIFSRRGCDTPQQIFENLPAITSVNGEKTIGELNVQKHTGEQSELNSSLQSISAIELPRATSSSEGSLRNIGMNPAFMQSEPRLLVSDEMQIQMQKIPVRKPVSELEEAWNLNSLHVMDSYSDRPKTSDGLGGKTSRPRIQVVIPNNEPRKIFSSVPFMSTDLQTQRPKIQNRSMSEISPPTVTSQKSIESFTVSAVSPSPNVDVKLQRMMSVRRSIRQSEPLSLNQYLQVPIKDSSHDGSSNDSTSGDEDTISIARSQRSSITSIDSQSDLQILESKEKEEEKQEIPGHRATKSTSSLPRLGDLIHIVRTPSTSQRPIQPIRSLSSGHVSIPLTLPEARNEDASRPPSPTLSEAERNLEAHLSTMSPTTSEVVETWLQEELTREHSIKRKPIPPPKSEKRMSRGSSLRSVTTIDSSSSLQDIQSVPEQPLRNFSLKRSSSVRSVLSLIAEDDEREISSDDAEHVIFMIMSNLHDLEDFFSMAVINGGFYKVAKQHELDLMEKILRNMSPAAWEFQQLSETWEISPSQFYKDYIDDSDVIGNIKLLILERCQSILRPDTVKELAKGHKPFRASRVDNALWRIWTFCRLFSGQKDKEEDIATQIDWLRGGVETRRDATSTEDQILTSDFSCEHFGLGNQGGLTADDLYDMTEMWNCVRTISQGIIGRTEQARQYGVFDDTDVRGGDIDGEEIMLEEWHSYLLTQGLPVAYEISKAATSLYAFSIAKRNRWTRWTPPENGVGRRRFLLEPCGRLYEERISESLSPATEIVDGERRSVRRRRRESFIQEIRELKAKQTEANVSEETEEKLMSRANSVIEQLSSSSSKGPSPLNSPYVPSSGFQSAVSPVVPSPGIPPILVHSPTRAPPPPPSNKYNRKDLSIPTNLPMLSSSSSPSLPSPTIPSTPPPHPIPMHLDSPKYFVSATLTGPYFQHWDMAPSPPSPKGPPLPPRPPMATLLQMQQPMHTSVLVDGHAELNTSDKAIHRIVEMGFTVADAKTALRTTDMGDGLKIDRAIEYLLRQQGTH